MRIDELLTGTSIGKSEESFFLKNNLNPVMTPFQESSGGKLQDAVILVDVFAVTEKLVGACEGAVIDELKICIYLQNIYM